MRQGATLQDGVAPGWSRTRLLVSRELELRLEPTKQTTLSQLRDVTISPTRATMYRTARSLFPALKEREEARLPARASKLWQVQIMAGSDWLCCTPHNVYSAASFNFNILVELSSARRLPASSLLI